MYKKYDALERVAQENVDFILAIRARVLSQQSYLRQLDRIGSFESDDEVGIFFKELKKIINDISTYLEVNQEELANNDTESQSEIRGTIEGF